MLFLALGLSRGLCRFPLLFSLGTLGRRLFRCLLATLGFCLGLFRGGLPLSLLLPGLFLGLLLGSLLRGFLRLLFSCLLGGFLRLPLSGTRPRFLGVLCLVRCGHITDQRGLHHRGRAGRRLAIRQTQHRQQ